MNFLVPSEELGRKLEASEMTIINWINKKEETACSFVLDLNIEEQDVFDTKLGGNWERTEVFLVDWGRHVTWHRPILGNLETIFFFF